MIGNELVIDLFAGGGGASCGIEMAGVKVDYAVNHDPVAVGIHKANHPHTQHFCQDIWQVDPYALAQGRPVGLLWASPDCTHHSRAKGGAPYRDKQRRELANVITEKWIPALMPRVIMLENVAEFQEWGPLDETGQIIPHQKGWEFERFIGEMRSYGYKVEWRQLAACDYGAPTTRKRLFLIARRDGEPIVWPEPTHGEGLIPYRSAAEIIDFGLPCPSIFLSPEEAKKQGCKRPLSENTLRRIAHGIMKYIVNSDNPFVVDQGAFNITVTGYGDYNKGKGEPSHMEDIQNPMGTAVASGAMRAVVSCTLANLAQTRRNCTYDINDQIRTIHSGGGSAALVTAFLAKYYGGVVGNDVRRPADTITTWDHHALVTANICKMRGTNIGSAADEPLQTITASGSHHATVQAFLIKYYGMSKSANLRAPLDTITTDDRFALVMVHGEPYYIADIGLRMLTPRELFAAQGFPSGYIFNEINGKPLTKKDQVRLCGNSVVPQLSKALAEANIAKRVTV